MGIFGKGKKSERDEDSGKLALFGSRSKNKSPPNNPYAQPAAPPDPYTQAKIDAGIIPPTQQTVGPRLPPGSGMGLPSGPSMKNGYGDINRSRYSPNQDDKDQKFGAPSAGHGIADGYRDDKYGNPDGYGQGKFGGNTYVAGMPAAAGLGYGSDGYGGLGRSNSIETTSTDVNRNELFGDASQRMQQRGVNAYRDPPPYAAYGADPGEGSSSMAYGDRQLTAEEQEEQDIEATKQEIRFLKQESVSSTRNALSVLAQTEETGRNTLAHLGAQGEVFHYTERNMDLAIAEQDRAKDLTKKLGRGIFHVNNPFEGGQGEKILQDHERQRAQQEATRKAAYESNQGMIRHFKDISKPGPTQPKSSLAERAKYQFEADSEDDEMEKEIENNLGKIGQGAVVMRQLAEAQRGELERQIEVLKRTNDKGKVLDQQLLINQYELKKASR